MIADEVQEVTDRFIKGLVMDTFGNAGDIVFEPERVVGLVMGRQTAKMTLDKIIKVEGGSPSNSWDSF